MSQVSNANLQSICDKAARHAAEANGEALASAIATGAAYTTTAPSAGGLLVANTDVLAALQTLVTGFTDPDQQIDFVPPAASLSSRTPLINQFIYSFWSGIRSALDAHMSRYSANAMLSGDLTPLDAALRVINTTTLLRLSGTFQKYFGGLSPANVFTPTPFVLATIAVTGATTATFTHVSKITGSYGPGQIAILNTKTEGLVSTAISVTGVQGGLSVTENFTVAVVTNNELTATTDTSKTFTDCTALVSISGGVVNDTFSIVILPDRTLSGA